MKFNTKNLWTGYLLRSFLFVFLLLGGLSFGIHNAKAEMGFSSGTVSINGSTISISDVEDEENNVLICGSNGSQYSTNSSWFEFNSATSSDIGFVSSANSGGAVGAGSYFSYIFSVQNGNFDFVQHIGTGGGSFECTVIEGVNINNPIEIISNTGSIGPSYTSYPYTFIVSGSYSYDPIVLLSYSNTSTFQRFGYINPYVDYFLSSYVGSYYYSTFNIIQLDSGGDEDEVFEYVNNAPSSWGNATVSVLNLEPAEPEVYLISETEDLYLQFNPLLNFCPTNTSCLLNYVYDTALFSNSADFLKIWYYETSTSTPEYLGIQPLATKWEFDILGSGYLIASSSTSTEQFSYYRVQPCQMNYPYACAGTSTVAFQFIEQKDPIEEIENMLNTPGNETIAQNQGGIITINPKEIACTQEEWDTPDPVIGIDWLNATTSVPALNFTKHVCNIKAGLIAIPIATGNVFKNWWEKTGDYISKIFPFGIIKNISNSWTNSASSTVPVALEWLVPVDESGNITMTIPASFIKQATSSEIVVFGPDLADSDSSWQEFATKIRGITTYLLWAGFLWGLYLFGIKIYNEIRE